MFNRQDVNKIARAECAPKARAIESLAPRRLGGFFFPASSASPRAYPWPYARKCSPTPRSREKCRDRLIQFRCCVPPGRAYLIGRHSGAGAFPAHPNHGGAAYPHLRRCRVRTFVGAPNRVWPRGRLGGFVRAPNRNCAPGRHPSRHQPATGKSCRGFRGNS